MKNQETDQTNPNRCIKAADVRDLCGGVSDMWLHRRLSNPASEFPRPFYISKRRFWRERDVVQWLESQAESA